MRIWIESCQSKGTSSVSTTMTRRAEDDTYAKHPEGVAEGGVTGRNTGLNIVAPRVTFEERTLAQLVEEIVNTFERSLWRCNQMKACGCMRAAGTHLTSFAMGARSSSVRVSPVSAISSRIEIKISSHLSVRRMDATRFV